MAKTIASLYHWPPDVYRTLYFDAVDYQGLEFWYIETRKTIKDLDAATKPKV